VPSLAWRARTLPCRVSALRSPASNLRWQRCDLTCESALHL